MRGIRLRSMAVISGRISASRCDKVALSGFPWLSSSQKGQRSWSEIFPCPMIPGRGMSKEWLSAAASVQSYVFVA
jgi:hypothetical protein